ncbi:MAG: twin-arginine translocase TatA/TatE family subunit [Helicobacteraceae bacterium]
MSMPGMQELIVILLIVVILFGAKKIPELASGLGKGIKNFKKSMKEDEDEPELEQKKQATTNIETGAKVKEN